MDDLWKHLRHYVTPTRENVFEPRLLGKKWLVFFFVLSMVVEGFLVSGLVIRQSDGVFLTEAPQVQTASVGSVQTVQTFARQFIRIVGDPKVVNSILGGIGLMLMVVVVLAFVLHIDIQSHSALAGGLVAAAIALLLLAANVHFLAQNAPQTAAGINALAP